jgi:glycosyltransferase involved in cell wall biosynthesis
MVTFCSIAGPSTLPHARVLASGLRREHAEARVVVLVSGEPVVVGDGEPFEAISLAELAGPEPASGGGGRALVDALRPRLLQRALDDGADVAVFLDAEICVYGSLEPALALARERGLVAVRRVSALPEDGARPSYRDLLAAGIVSPAFLAVSSSADGERFLRWWSERVAQPGEATARWLDLAADLFPFAVLGDPGYNVSFWNLHERPLERRDEQLFAGGEPLRSIHYDGFRPDEPHRLGRADGRVRVSDDPVLAQLCADYAERVLAAGWSSPAEQLAMAPRSAQQVADSRLGVNVMGFLRNTLGLAEAARLYVEALSGGGLPVSTTAISADLPVDPATGKTVKRSDQSYEDRRAPAAPAFNLACMNGDHLTHLVQAAGEQILGGRPTIGHWAWETDVVPPSWFEGFKYVEEVWVNSTFVAENLGRVAPVPVVVVPQATVVPDPAGVELAQARDDRFTFLFMLDFFSTLRRKNPLGLIDAFTRAFRPGEGPRLLLKTINAQFRRQDHDELSSRIGDRPDIELIDGILDPLQKTALVARADCYVSLHRSEGFGLTLAESMALGTPVIATGYSGNMDFTTPQNSYLVDWTPTLVGPDCEIYPHDGRWAEPDLDHAAELMRRVWERPDEARAKAQRARVDIERLYAPAVVGRVARARLELLSARRSALATDPAPTGALAAVERELRFDVRRGGAPTPDGLAGVLRRAVLRLMMPFTVHERILDRALADGVRELRLDLNHKRLQGVRVRARLRRLEERLAVEAQVDDTPGGAEAPARSATIA